jgi:hypothetical protein
LKVDNYQGPIPPPPSGRKENAKKARFNVHPYR